MEGYNSITQKSQHKAPLVNHLGEFLRSRRGRLSPEDVGVPSYGRRRVSGLRREELAQLAGVSVTYYTRLEQGQSQNASDSIIESLARALRLTPDERTHLFALAHPNPVKRVIPSDPESPNKGALNLLLAMESVPAIILGRRNDILAWNKAGHILLAGHLDFEAPTHKTERPNMVRMLFLDLPTRKLYRDWELEAATAVASLRYIAAQFPDDARLQDLIDELNTGSQDFARLWNQHTVRLCTSGIKKLHHPEVGNMELSYEALHLPEDDGQRFLTHSALPGSSSQDTLRVLLNTI